MSIVKIQNLKDLSAQDKRAILTRSSLDLDDIVRNVIQPMADEFRSNPLESLKKATLKFDKSIPEPFVLETGDLARALDRVRESSPEVIRAFELAGQNIREFHKRQIPSSFSCKVGENELGYRFQPFNSAALYVPGGKALYPSTVMMGSIPAALAGVSDLVLMSPPSSQTGKVSDIVCAVAAIAGVKRVLQAGGAQAVLAAAFGIPELDIEPVDYIYGPGNIYVAAAKNFVAQNNYCGIDSFAGPSEVAIIADHRANPYWLAHDLLAQAEHDENATAILLVTDRTVAEKTAQQLEVAISSRGDRSAITEEAMRRNGYIFIVDSLDEAIAFSNKYAPEHLEIQTEKPRDVLEKITSAASIFVGDYAPVAAGDYFTGTNHILPTGGAARFASGVSVHSFYKRITWQDVSASGLKAACEPIEVMSKVEGLFDEHGWSVLARFEDEKNV